MRYLILSDMHGNYDALAAVLRRVRRKRFDATLVLGDLVGYGAAPNQVVNALRGLQGTVYTVRGNHDKVVAGLDDGSSFNAAALKAARWTTKRLTAANLRLVRDLPQGPVEVNGGVTICHGSPLDEDAYVFSDLDALQIFSACAAKVIFFGHTHIPSVFAGHADGVEVAVLKGTSGKIQIEPEGRYLVNPGSIGQPRDRDPRACFMVYDQSKSVVHWQRVEYLVARAQKRILDAGLPKVLADRLAVGA